MTCRIINYDKKNAKSAHYNAQVIGNMPLKSVYLDRDQIQLSAFI